MKKQSRWNPSLIMASFMCDFSCPRLCISVGSNTPMLPLGTIINRYIFQVATGKLRRKINQCNEMSINTVTMVWPTNSGRTHCKGRTKYYISWMFASIYLKLNQRPFRGLPSWCFQIIFNLGRPRCVHCSHCLPRAHVTGHSLKPMRSSVNYVRS